MPPSPNRPSSPSPRQCEGQVRAQSHSCVVLGAPLDTPRLPPFRIETVASTAFVSDRVRWETTVLSLERRSPCVKVRVAVSLCLCLCVFVCSLRRSSIATRMWADTWLHTEVIRRGVRTSVCTTRRRAYTLLFSGHNRSTESQCDDRLQCPPHTPADKIAGQHFTLSWCWRVPPQPSRTWSTVCKRKEQLVET